MDCLILASLNSPTLFDTLDPDHLSILPPGMIDQIKRFRQPSDRSAHYLGYWLITQGLIWLNIPYSIPLEFQINPYGKPSLKDIQLHFNISHSGDWVICAFSRELEIGIDIEQEVPVDLADFKIVFSDQEYQTLLHTPDYQSLFFNYWTQKESLCKAVGQGLNMDAANVNPDMNPVILEGKTWYLKKIQVVDGYSCHLAADHPITTWKLEILKFQ